MKKSRIAVLFAVSVSMGACSTKENNPEPMTQMGKPLINFSGDVRVYDEFGQPQSPGGVEIALGSSGSLKTLSTAAGTYSFRGISLPGSDRFLKAVDVRAHRQGLADGYHKPVDLEFPCTFRFQLYNASTAVVSALQTQVEGESIVVRGVVINDRAKAGNDSWVTLFVGIDNTNVSVSQSDAQYNFPVTCATSGVPTAFTYRISKNDFQRYQGNSSALSLLAYGNIPARLDDGRADASRMVYGYPKINAEGQSYHTYPGLGPLPSEKVTVKL